MKVALLVDKNNDLATDEDRERSILLYECYNSLHTFISRLNIDSDEGLMEYLYLSKVDLLFLRDCGSEFEKLAEEYRISLMKFKRKNLDLAFQDFFSLGQKDERNSLSENGMVKSQKFVEPYELASDFEILYGDDDSIGGS